MEKFGFTLEERYGNTICEIELGISLSCIITIIQYKNIIKNPIKQDIYIIC